MPPGLQCANHQRRVEMVPCRDENGSRVCAALYVRICDPASRRLVLVPGREYGAGVRRSVTETKLRPDMIRAQRGVVDDGAEPDAALQVREQHRSREVAGPDDVEMSDRSRQALRRQRFGCSSAAGGHGRRSRQSC